MRSTNRQGTRSAGLRWASVLMLTRHVLQDRCTTLLPGRPLFCVTGKDFYAVTEQGAASASAAKHLCLYNLQQPLTSASAMAFFEIGRFAAQAAGTSLTSMFCTQLQLSALPCMPSKQLLPVAVELKRQPHCSQNSNSVVGGTLATLPFLNAAKLES